MQHLSGLLTDEHALRRVAGLVQANELRELFAAADQLFHRLSIPSESKQTLRSLIAAIRIGASSIEVVVKPSAPGLTHEPTWTWIIPWPSRKPFGEAKLKIDAASSGDTSDPALVVLLSEAMNARDLVHASSGLSLNQIALRAGRCRKQLTKLYRLSHLSPRIVEAIVDGTLPSPPCRKALLEAELPVSWDDQHLLFGLATS